MTTLRERMDATDWSEEGVALFGKLLRLTEADDESELIIMALAARLIVTRCETPPDLVEQVGEFMELCLETRRASLRPPAPDLRVVGGRDAD